MAAGDGAAEQSRLAAERVERLRRELEQAERSAHAWSVGAAGEALVAKAVTSLEVRGWLALHDVHWPGRPKANLDHVLVGPGGILVVDAKNWSGDVRLSDGVLRQNGYLRDREVVGVLQQSASVAALLEPRHRRYVHGWLCMVGQPHIMGVTSNGVRIMGLETLTGAIAQMPAVLDAAEVSLIHGYLNAQLAGRTSPPLLTTAQFIHANAPAASVQKWRTHQNSGSRSAAPRRKPRRQSKRPSCLVVLLQLTMLFVGVSLLMSFAFGQRSAPPAAPRPSPSVSQTMPAR